MAAQPVAIAPEVTRTTSHPSSCKATTSSHKLSTVSVLTAPSGKVTDEDPILTTTRCMAQRCSAAFRPS